MYYTDEFISIEDAIKLMSKAEKGEYYGDYDGMLGMYLTIAPKREIKTDWLGFKILTKSGKERFYAFCNAIESVRYALSSLTNGKLGYTSTNDLNTYIVR